jgi:hypothetical protein
MRPRASTLAFAAIAGLAALVISACAPEPTTPSDISLGGVWTSNAHLFSLSQLKLNLVQEANGIVSGTWSAKGDGGTGGCAPATPCDASGNLIGVNTVANVNLELLGAGSFEGALVESSKLRGALRVGADYDTISFFKTAR